MFRIALIHTVRSVIETFEKKIIDAIEDVKIINTLDEYLASDAAERGEFTTDNLNRFFYIIKCAEMAEADIIVVTCSTLTPAVEKVRPFIKVPVIAIDEAMLNKAAQFGGKITIMATAESTLSPTKNKLLKEAEKFEKNVEISTILCTEAFTALKNGNKQLHDEILKKEALAIKDQDIVILAQASMAHLDKTIEKICGCTVLSSTDLCIKQIKQILKKDIPHPKL